MHLTIQALPKENQLAPTNAIIVKDLNKDGRLEVITVGNLFPVEVETGRYDALVGTVSLLIKTSALYQWIKVDSLLLRTQEILLI